MIVLIILLGLIVLAIARLIYRLGESYPQPHTSGRLEDVFFLVMNMGVLMMLISAILEKA